MSEHTKHLPLTDLPLPHLCDGGCGKPAVVLVWRFGLELCRECWAAWRRGVVWERGRKLALP